MLCHHNYPGRDHSPLPIRCRSDLWRIFLFSIWLPELDSNQPYSRLTAEHAHLECYLGINCLLNEKLAIIGLYIIMLFFLISYSDLLGSEPPRLGGEQTNFSSKRQLSLLFFECQRAVVKFQSHHTNRHTCACQGKPFEQIQGVSRNPPKFLKTALFSVSPY